MGWNLLPGYFQRFLESSVCHIPKTVVRVDDILVFGCDDAEHLKNLQDLFEILLKIVAKVKKKSVVSLLLVLNTLVSLLTKMDIVLIRKK